VNEEFEILPVIDVARPKAVPAEDIAHAPDIPGLEAPNAVRNTERQGHCNVRDTNVQLSFILS
jgi:hypothetical protein